MCEVIIINKTLKKAITSRDICTVLFKKHDIIPHVRIMYAFFQVIKILIKTYYEEYGKTIQTCHDRSHAQRSAYLFLTLTQARSSIPRINP